MVKEEWMLTGVHRVTGAGYRLGNTGMGSQSWKKDGTNWEHWESLRKLENTGDHWSIQGLGTDWTDAGNTRGHGNNTRRHR